MNEWMYKGADIMNNLFNVSNDLQSLPGREAAHGHVVLGSGGSRQRIDARGMAKRLVFRYCKNAECYNTELSFATVIKVLLSRQCHRC